MYPNKGGKERTAIYYEQNKDWIKKKQTDRYKNVNKEKIK